MSIAVNALVRPSRRQLYALLALCVMLSVTAIAVAFDWVGSFSVERRLIIAAATIIFILFALLQYLRQPITYRIDISRDGTIRLAVRDQEGQVVSLQDGSTLWQGLMLLRLRFTSGAVLVLRIAPDTVTEQDFYALSIALRWIAARQMSGRLTGDEGV